MKNVKRILVPIDFSVHSRQAALRAVEFGRLLGAKVKYLHVVDSRYTDSLFAGYLEDRAGRWSEILSAAEKHLAEFVDSLDHSGVDYELEVQDGIPADCVVETPTDLIVLGSRGRTGVDRLICGSQTEQILRHSGKPMLIVHAPVSE
jgi:nucleotide-binding universal stress UspA family protein